MRNLLRSLNPSFSLSSGAMSLVLVVAFGTLLFSGCGNPPFACFTVDSVVDQNAEVTIANCSQFVENGVAWDFGDGTTSDHYNPVHTYTERGDYLIVLTVKGKTSAQDDNTSEIIKVGQRMLTQVEITSLPATKPGGGPWDASDGPDVAVLFIKNGTTAYTTSENTNLADPTPFTINELTSNFDITPETWTFAIVDVDPGGLDTMATYTVDMKAFVPNATKTIEDGSADADFTISYSLQ